MNELITINAASVNENHFGVDVAEMQAAVESCKGLTVSGIDDDTGLAAVREARLKLKGMRVEVEKRRKEIKQGALEFGRAVDSVANRLKALIEPEEKRLQSLEDGIAKQIEELRQQRLSARQSQLRAVGADYLDAFVERLSDEQFAKVLAEKTAEHQQKLEEQRQEQERLRLEQEAKERAEAAERERIRLEQEAEQKRLEAERERLRVEREAVEKRLEAERERLRVEREAVEKRLAAEREELRKQQEAELERRREEESRLQTEREEQRKKQAEEEVRLREEREKIAAERAEIERQKREAEEAEQRKREEAEEAIRLEEARKRAEALRPTRVQLLQVAEDVECVTVPDVPAELESLRYAIQRELKTCAGKIQWLIDSEIPAESEVKA